MPRLGAGSLSPTIAILSGFDATAWSGNAVMLQGVKATVLPVFTANEGEYRDVISFLNGYGSQTNRTLKAEVVAGGTGAGVWDLYMDTEDRLVLTNDTDTFSISSGSSVYGFSTGQASVVVGGLNVIQADSEWARGVYDLNAVTVTQGASTFKFPSTANEIRVQSVPVHLEDAGTAGGTLESRNNDALDNASRRIRWGLTDDGHVYWYATSMVAATAITWISTSFRDRLGFSGDEVLVSGAGRTYQIADNPCPGAIVLQRPALRLNRGWEHVGSNLRLADGSYATAQRGDFHSTELEVFISGPMGNANREDIHWERQMVKYLYPGAPVTLFQDWGDTRIRGFVALNESYSGTVTVQNEGERGRIIGSVAPEGGTTQLVWEDDFRMLALVRLGINETQM